MWVLKFSQGWNSCFYSRYILKSFEWFNELILKIAWLNTGPFLQVKVRKWNAKFECN